MKETIKYGLLTGGFITTMGFLLFQIFPRPLVLLFNDDPALVELTINALKIISLAFPVIGVSIIASTTFQAVGRGVISLIISFLRQIIVLLPAAYILAKIGGVDYLWYAFPLSELASAIILIFLFKRVFRDVFAKMKKGYIKGDLEKE